VKRFLMGCAALFVLGAISAPPAFADPASDAAAAAKKDEANAKAARDRAAHYAKSATGEAKKAGDAADASHREQSEDAAEAAKKEQSNAHAARDRAAHYAKSATGEAKKAVDTAAGSRKEMITRHARHRKHRLHRNEQAVSQSADVQKKAVTDTAHAEKRALDQQHR